MNGTSIRAQALSVSLAVRGVEGGVAVLGLSGGSVHLPCAHAPAGLPLAHPAPIALSVGLHTPMRAVLAHAVFFLGGDGKLLICHLVTSHQMFIWPSLCQAKSPDFSALKDSSSPIFLIDPPFPPPALCPFPSLSPHPNSSSPVHVSLGRFRL